MITKNTNKFGLNSSTIGGSALGGKSKILVLGFMLFILVGLLSPVAEVQAQGATGGQCFTSNGGSVANYLRQANQAACEANPGGTDSGLRWGVPPVVAPAPAATVRTCWYRGAIQGSGSPGYVPGTIPSTCFGAWQEVGQPPPPPPNGPPLTGPAPTPGTVVTDPCSTVGTGRAGDSAYDACKRAEAATAAGRTASPATPPASTSELQRIVDEDFKCGFWIGSSLFPGCLVNLIYYTFYTIASWLLAIAAMFFNALVYLTLQSTLYTIEFIPQAWAIVRDLSNIFFIMILLYIAIKIILDLGGSEAKKMIINVLLIALLINFSMFFTKVVIDSSNILALIFYNKLNVDTRVGAGPNAAQRAYTATFGEKDVSGGLVNSFSPGELLKPEFFELAKATTLPDGTVVPGKPGDKVPTGIMLGLILIYGLVMAFAAYAFFIAGVSFVGRLIELWMLIIFSPFAFLSWTIPELKSIGGIGWTSWWDKLLKTAFMAPIFMFFMYLIFLFTKLEFIKNIGGDKTTFFGAILAVIIPAMIILMLLMKATDYAKKGAGQLGEALTKYAGAALGVAGGLALGAATGGAGLAMGAAGALGRTSIGRVAGNLAESNTLRDFAARNSFGAGLQKTLGGIGASSFDIRGASIGGKTLASAPGLKGIGKAQEGGFVKARADKVKRKEEFATKMLDTSDYGMAQMTRGGMGVDQANRHIAQMQSGGAGLSFAQQNQRRRELVGGGMSIQDVKIAKTHINAARRDSFADRLQRRMPMSGQIAANNVRKSAQTQQQNANLAALVTQLQGQVQALGGQPQPQQPQAPQNPPVCWVAEVLYGVNDYKTHAARLWASTNDNWFTKLYVAHGQSWAKWLSNNKWAQPIVKPIWDVMAIRGQSLAIKIRSNESKIDKKYDYLLEKVK